MDNKEKVYCEDCEFFSPINIYRGYFTEECNYSKKRLVVKKENYKHPKREVIETTHPFSPETQNKNNDCKYYKGEVFSVFGISFSSKPRIR